MLALVATSPECEDILKALFQPGGNELFLRPMGWLVGKVRCSVNPPSFTLLLLLRRQLLLLLLLLTPPPPPCPHLVLLQVLLIGKVLW